MDISQLLAQLAHPSELQAVRIDNPLQVFLVPYVGYINLFYWVSYFGIIAYLATRYILLPLVRQRKDSTPKESSSVQE